jgi:YidC/Oxa1 family membrane protein insertase
MPILLQTPFFMGLYRVLSHVAAGNAAGALSKSDAYSIQHANFFGAPLSLSFLHHTSSQMAKVGVTSVTNLQVVAIIMAIVYATSQFLTQRMMMSKNTNLDNSIPNPMMQSQKIMLYVMPFGMLFFSLNVQIGVVLYLMTTNVWTIGQQFYTLRNSPMPGSQAEKEMLARRKAKEDHKREELIAKDPEAAKEMAAANGSGVQDKVPVSRQRQQPVRTTRSKRKK